MPNTQELLDYARIIQQCRIFVIGDLMIDEYVWGHIERISPEAPVPILRAVRNERFLGGTGNVVRNLRALGAQVEVCGVVGRDDTGEEVTELIERLGVETSGIVQDTDRKSTRKTRLMSLEHGQQVFRMDEETLLEVDERIEDRIIAQIEQAAAHTDVIVCSDYMKGVLTSRVLIALFHIARENSIPSVVGPKDSSAQKYRGANILMPNQKELALLTQTVANENGWLTESARQLVQNLDLRALVVTRGSDGMSLFEKTCDGLQRRDIPTTARSVYDVTGAGDTALSVFAACVAAKADLDFAVCLANLAAGIKVAKRGTSTVTIPEIQQHVLDHGDACADLLSRTCAKEAP